ncbi:TonB-dependent receptor [Novosphingobium sediminis]|uniref:TonB-dependent receptor n=1 Tax=Novosphingobium sediminis TaxID=707214 RepID=A0A512AFQ7_9SPHN|nr:TonB-dependent receptor [Novosphingobium sediminis]GEN98521.1 TonB-dependent receptor [Novosphingobium sediminis]
MTMKTGRRSRTLRALCLSTILTGIAAPHAAFAQEALAPQAAPAEEGKTTGGFDEIIVTATRKAESVQKVPIAIQALSSDFLAQRQVKGLQDYAALLPSVSFAGIGPGRNEVYFRGIVPAGGAYASVGYYLDEIPITGQEVPDIQVYDMERLEAISGPQGTLFGAGSLAGVLRFITNKPKIGSFEFGADSEINKFGKGGVGGTIKSYINIPVSDRFAIRAMGYYRKEGGYIDNTDNKGQFISGTTDNPLQPDPRPAVLNLGDDNPATSYTLSNASIAKKDYNPVYEYGGRLSMLWDVTDGWEVTPAVTAQRQISYGYFGYDPRVGDLQVHDYDLTRNDDKWVQAALTVHGHIGDFDLVSATGYYYRNRKINNDYTYYTVTYDSFGAGYENYLQFFDKSGCSGSGATLKCTTLLNPNQYYHTVQRNKKFTQEVRLTTPKTWPFDVTVGAFYQRQKNQTDNNYAIRGLDQIVGYTESGGGDNNPDGFGIPQDQGGTMILGTPAVRGDAYYLEEFDTLYHDTAVFAEAHYNILPNVKITGGIRYFWTDYQVVGFQGVGASAAVAPSIFLPTGAVGCPLPLTGARLECRNTNALDPLSIGRYSEKGQTHKVVVDWQFADQKLLYFNYSTGFRPGGYNRPLRLRKTETQPQVVVAAPPFEAETLTNFEIGFKGTFNNVFRLNAAIYFEKWNNIQYGLVVAGAQGAGYTGNAGKAEVKGIEYDAELKLGKFTISSSGAYNDGKLKGNFCNFVANRDTKVISQLATCAPGEFIPGNLDTPSVAAADGTRLPRQPKFKGTTTIRLDTDFGSMKGYLQGAVLYQTGATQDLNEFNNNLLGNTAGFVSFDFGAGVRKDHWTADIFIQNAFDRRGQLTRNTFCSISVCAGSSRTFPIRPQFFGLKLGYRY